MNKPELISQLQQTDLLKTASKTAIAEFLDTFCTIIVNEVANGADVSIPGFGKFYQFTSSTSGKKSPKFAAFKDFKESIGQ